MLSRRLSSLLLMSALVAGLFAGCRTLGESISDTPLSLVPNTQEFLAQRGVTDNANSNGTTNANGNTNGSTPRAAFFGTGLGGTQLFLGCPGEIAADGSTVTDYNCGTFACEAQAQTYYTALRATGRSDCHDLDRDNDGTVCVGSAAPNVCP